MIVFISNYMGSYKNQRAATTHVIKRAVITKLVINYQSALKSKMLNICDLICEKGPLGANYNLEL